MALITLLIPGLSQAQDSPEAHEIKIGEKVPDIIIQTITNYDKDAVKLSDFRGKWLILDFWATWCSPCIAMISKMDSLQHALKDKVQFLSITYEKRETVLPFLEKLYQKEPSAIPVVYEDTLLKKYFPNNVFPHYVWLDEEGVVRAITEAKEITKANIEEAIQGGHLDLRVKKDDEMLAYNKVKQPLLNFLLKTDQQEIPYYSFFTSYKEGLGGGMCTSRTGDGRKNITRITFVNMSAIWFFKYAFGEGRKFFQDESVDIDVREPEKIYSMATGLDAKGWMIKNTFCYELKIPEERAPSAWQTFRADVQKFFSQYDMFVEMRRKKVLALVRTSEVDKIKSKGGEPRDKRDRFGYQAANIRVQDFILALSWQSLADYPLQIVDRTGYVDRIDLKLEANLSNIAELNRELSKYDLQLKELEDVAEVLVVRDRQSAR